MIIVIKRRLKRVANLDVLNWRMDHRQFLRLYESSDKGSDRAIAAAGGVA